ncbi:DYNLRB2 isoform 5 [Pongo abelii]|uniref:DYNLRB2 isoform 5 n=1 Tax=Pongo abelii TaxID=9601 RepID=A0A2J8VWP3_PONAB|nr:DYNLRB2 isoform 5 [Pongo abelii]
MAEVEETLKRIQSHKGVIGTMVVNAEGKKTNTMSQIKPFRADSL